MKERRELLIFATTIVLGLLMFSFIGYSTDWTCLPLKFYYDSDHNGKYSPDDVDITTDIENLVRDGVSYLPLYTIVRVAYDDCNVNNKAHCCTKSMTFHCSNTARRQETAYGNPFLTVYKGGKVVMHVTERTIYLPHISTSSEKQQLFNIYKNHLYTDISFQSVYNGDLNPFNYVNYNLLPTLVGYYSTDNFEDIIINQIPETIVSHLPSYMRCSVTHYATSYAKITCTKEERIPYSVEVYDNKTNTTRTETRYRIVRHSDTMYLNFENIFHDILSPTYNLAQIEVQNYVEFTTEGGNSVKVAENVKEFYVDEPGVVYSIYQTPRVLMTCHGRPGHIWCPEI